MVQIFRQKNPNWPLDREKMWYEYRDGKRVTDPAILEYIKSLVIPPAYSDVQIEYSKNATPKVLYRGTDEKGRVQVIYSKQWSEKARKRKLCNLIGFGKVLPQMQADMRRQLQSERFTRNKVISLVLRIVEHCNIRIGQSKYQDLYKSYGVTTLRKDHLKMQNGYAEFDFVGKKGARNQCTLDDPLIVSTLKELLKAHPGDHIFAYHLDGVWEPVTALDVNDWLKEYNASFTSKMFRTFSSNVMLISMLRDAPDPVPLSKAQRKKEVVKVVREIAERIHNTPAIAKKSYIDIDLIDLYIEKPRSYRSQFITNQADPRVVFMNWLKKKCGVESEADVDKLLADIDHEATEKDDDV